MDNKSQQGGTFDNGIDSGNPQVTAPSGPGPFTGSSGGGDTTIYRQKPGGYEGPGRGHAMKLNSDDQMPVAP